MLDGELAVVDYEAGRIGPPPQWVRVMHAAKWMGVEPWALAAQDDEWTAWALCLMELEHTAQERANAGRKGGKR